MTGTPPRPDGAVGPDAVVLPDAVVASGAAGVAEGPVDASARARGHAGVILRGGSWQAFAQLSPLLINIVLTPVIIRGLGVDRYGLFILVNIIAALLGNFDGGIGGAAQRYFAVYAGRGDTLAATRLLWTLSLVVTGVAVVVFGAFFFAVPPAMSLFHIPRHLLGEGAFLMRTLVVVVAVALLRGLFAGIINARQRFALTSLTQQVGYVVYITGMLVTVSQGWGLRAVAVTFMAQQVAVTLLIVPAALKLVDRGRVDLLDRSELGEFLRYALPVQWAGIMNLLGLETDAFVVGGFLPVRQVGVFSTGANFAWQLRNLPANALAPLQTVLGNAVGARGAEAAVTDFERLQRMWVSLTTGWGVVALSAAYFGILAWLGPAFERSGVVAVIMLVGYLPELWSGALTIWTQVQGRPDLNARCATAAAVVNVVLTVALIVPFGLVGTVLATAATQVAASLYLLRLARLQLPHHGPSYLRDVPVLPAVAAAVLVVALELLARPVVPSGALGLVSCGLVAAPGLVLFGLVAYGPRRLRAWLRNPRAILQGG